MAAGIRSGLRSVPSPRLPLAALTARNGWPETLQPGTLHCCPCDPGEPHLFALALPDTAEAWIAELGPLASPARRSLAAGFRNPMDALRCLAAEALLWRMAKQLYDLGPGQLSTTKGPQGKPAFVEHPGLHFNLSHSGPWILCAFDDGPVGVDVEAEAPLRPGMAEAVLSGEEWRCHQALPEGERPAAFFRLWTLKESLLKAAGTGLGPDPRRIQIGPGHASLGGAPPAPPGCTWNLRPLPLPPGAWAALCWAR